MPRRGGAAAKLGERFEGRWTLKQLIEVLDGRAIALELEILEDDQGVEFVLERPGRKERHQVKRQIAGLHYWNIGALGRAGVLAAARKSVVDHDCDFVFVSSSSAGPLQELTEWARIDLEEPYSEALIQDLGHLNQEWASNAGETRSVLRRTWVRTEDELTLTQDLESLIGSLVRGEPRAVIGLFGDFLRDSVHRRIDATSAWDALPASFGPQPFRDPDVKRRIDDLALGYLVGVRPPIVDIQREQASELVLRLSTDDISATLAVVGPAGSGKSTLLGQAVAQLRGSGWVVLPIRLDQLEAASSASRVGTALGLPSSPALVLGGMTNDRVLLLIDQLDAASAVSGRRPEYLAAVHELLREARAFDNLRVIVGCRRWELDHDDRLQLLVRNGLVGERLEVDLLSNADVADGLANAGFDSSSLDSTQLQLLRLPLHFGLLVRSGTASPRTPFASRLDLLDRYWSAKTDKVGTAAGDERGWVRVVDAVCEQMSARMELSVAREILDAYPRTTTLMVSEGVLEPEGRRYRFFHDTFFDYAFARRFAGRGRRLGELLSDDEQLLFRRAQVRQILAYRRPAATAEYLDDMRFLLDDEGIRFHLKEALVTFLAGLDDPTDEEWRIVLGHLLESSPIAPRLWSLLHGNEAWLRRADASGVLERWLADHDDERIDRTIRLLLSAQRYMPGRVAALIEPFVERDGRWRDRLRYLFRFAQSKSDPAYVRLYLRFLQHDAQDGGADPSEIFELLHGLVPTSVGIQALATFIRARLKASIQHGSSNPFAQGGTISESDHGIDQFGVLASSAPATFTRQILPLILSIAEAMLNQAIQMLSGGMPSGAIAPLGNAIPLRVMRCSTP